MRVRVGVGAAMLVAVVVGASGLSWGAMVSVGGQCSDSKVAINCQSPGTACDVWLDQPDAGPSCIDEAQIRTLPIPDLREIRALIGVGGRCVHHGVGVSCYYDPDGGDEENEICQIWYRDAIDGERCILDA